MLCRSRRGGSSVTNWPRNATPEGTPAREKSSCVIQDKTLRCTISLAHQNTKTSIRNLTTCYERMGQPARAEPLHRELADFWKQQAGADSPQYAGQLAALGDNLLQQKKPGEAEPVLRECLAIRAKKEPDAWTAFNTKSMLGGALLGQQKYADAEPLLLQTYEGMKQRADMIPKDGRARVTEALARLVQLYDAWGKPDEAAKWRKELEVAGRTAEKPRSK
jgi:hypothetical protein